MFRKAIIILICVFIGMVILPLLWKIVSFTISLFLLILTLVIIYLAVDYVIENYF